MIATEEEKISRLNSSFETFISVTEELKLAYDLLRDRAATMDLKLQEANRSLSDKVLEQNALLQSLPNGVAALNKAGEVIQFNRAAEKLLNVRAKEVVGKKLSQLRSIKNALILGMDQKLWPKPGVEQERILFMEDKRRLVVASRIAQMKDSAGNPAGWIEILTDVTEKDRLRREVHRLDTLKAMGEMAANAAHQIRNPLNGVEGFASLLLRKMENSGLDRDTGVKYSRNIVRGVREVNAIISGMLMLSKPDQLQLKAVNVDNLLMDVADSVRRVVESTGRAAEIQFNSRARGVWITGDDLKLKQIFLNICHNAVEALPEKGRRLIRMSTQRRGDRVIVRITDSGKGMAQEIVKKLFNPFFTTRETGTGLGLSVAAKYVDLHGGRLSVRSMPQRATVFKIELAGCLSAEKRGD